MNVTPEQATILQRVWANHPERAIEAFSEVLRRRMLVFWEAQHLRKSDWRTEWNVRDLRCLPVYRRYLYGPLEGAKGTGLASRRLLGFLRRSLSKVFSPEDTRHIIRILRHRRIDWIGKPTP